MTPTPSRPTAQHATLRTAAATLLAFATCSGSALAADAELAPIREQLSSQHDANVKRLKDWIALPSIAAENLNATEGAEYMAKLLLDAGFQHRRSHRHRRQAGRVRHARRRRTEDAGRVLHVRRQAVRPEGMELRRRWKAASSTSRTLAR
jgi:hypothetical protein